MLTAGRVLLWVFPVVGTFVIVIRGRRVVRELDAVEASSTFRSTILGFLMIFVITLMLTVLALYLTASADTRQGVLVVAVWVSGLGGLLIGLVAWGTKKTGLGLLTLAACVVFFMVLGLWPVL